MTQQDRDHQANLEWIHSVQRCLLGDDGTQALAVLLCAGWAALSTMAPGCEPTDALSEQLREAKMRLREELARQLSALESLENLTRQVLGQRWPALPWMSTMTRLPPPLLPHLGLMQKEQAQLEDLHRTVNDYRLATARYADVLGELFETTLGGYRRELTVGEDAEPESHSALELHDLWIRVAERTYERFLGSEDHTRAFAELTNTWAELQLSLRPVVDQVLTVLGLPARGEVDEIQRHLDRLRRQQRTDTARLEQEIAGLREELAALRAAPTSPPSGSNRRSGKRS